MPACALLIRHKTRPGRRDDVRRVWEEHLAPAIASNPDHMAYVYCFDDADPDALVAFQQYTSREASAAFLRTDAYAAYLRAVEPLLAGPPTVSALTPIWSKAEVSSR